MAMLLPAIRAIGVLAVLTVFIAAPGTPAAAQGGGGIGGLTFGPRNDRGPRYEFYPERLWQDYKRGNPCRGRLPNGRVMGPLNPRACQFNELR
jgi:hypothetical protein